MMAVLLATYALHVAKMLHGTVTRSHPEISSFGYRTMINQGDCHYALQFQLALHLNVRNSSNSNPDSHVNSLKHVLI